MQIEQINELYDYNNWANQRLWETVESVSTEQLNVDMHNGIGTIFTTLVHLVNASWIWLSRWEGNAPARVLLVADFPSLQ